MKKTFRLLVLILLAIVLLGCNSQIQLETEVKNTNNMKDESSESQDENENKQQADQNINIEKLRNYETKTLEYKNGDDEISISYPYFSYPKVDEKITSEMKSKFKQEKSRLTESANFDDGGMEIPYVFSIEFREPVITEDYISISFTKYTYQGGVHGMHTIVPLNYDLEENRIITLPDVLEKHSTDLETVANITYNKLISGEVEVNYFPNRIKENTAPDPKVYKNFSLTKESMLIYFQPYQIAPYSAGIVEVTIDWEQLESK